MVPQAGKVTKPCGHTLNEAQHVQVHAWLITQVARRTQQVYAGISQKL